jgi:hypothetical protein
MRTFFSALLSCFFLFSSGQTVLYDGKANTSLNGTAAKWSTIKVAATGLKGGTVRNLSYCILDFTGSDFTGTINMGELYNVNIIGLYQHDAGLGIAWSGHSENVNFIRNTGRNLGTVNDFTGSSRTYNGTQNSLVWYNVNFDSSYYQGCGPLIFGSWGGGATNNNFADSVSFWHTTVKNTKGNGTMVRGNFWRGGMHSVYTIYDSATAYAGTTVLVKYYNNQLGDVGWWYINGSLTCMENSIFIGGRGYADRTSVLNLNGRVDNCYLHNNYRAKTSTYGFHCPSSYNEGNVQVGTFTQLGTGVYKMWNETQVDCQDDINYWSSIVVLGTSPYLLITLDNSDAYYTTVAGVGTASGPNAGYLKDKFWNDQSNGTQRGKATGNVYYATYQGLRDPLTGAKLSATITTGFTPVTTVTTPPVVIPPTAGCDSAGIISAYLKLHPCPPAPKVDSQAVYNSWIKTHPIPASTPRLVTQVIDTWDRNILHQRVFVFDDGLTQTDQRADGQ